MLTRYRLSNVFKIVKRRNIRERASTCGWEIILMDAEKLKRFLGDLTQINA